MSERPLGLLTRIAGETAEFASLEPERKVAWWRDELPAALRGIDADGGRTVALWSTTWSSDWHYVLAHEFRDGPALERAAERLRNAGVYRHLRTSRILGRRWGGEPGWDADKWQASDRHAPFGGVLFYRIHESLYTLSETDIQRRHGERRRILDAAIAELIRAGGQRLGSYFCEWSSEWHLYVLYEFPDLAAAETFNAGLPERHGYLDYDIVFVLGRRLADPAQLTRP